jgi:prepilin-type N-terminal cleavage/methylation domain-containing protein
MGRRFTLVELMIAIAIVAILAAIAVPLVATAQMKAKRAEAPLNLDGIMGAIAAYHAALNDPPPGNSGFQPSSLPGKALRPWDDGSIPTQFTAMGWAPDGLVRGRYYYQDNTTNRAVWTYMDVNGDTRTYTLYQVFDLATGTKASPIALCSAGALDGCY